MTKNMTFSRRGFLIGSAAIAGGIVFGTLARAEKGAKAATINPYVTITPEKITLITPRADIGQGVASVQAALIAEELDLELGQFEISFGKPDPVYANTALADEFIDFQRYDFSPEAEAAREQAAAFIVKAGMQATGGSSSVAFAFDRLRTAGAVARETLKAAAAKRTGIPVANLKTQAGAIILPDETRIPFTELAAEAAEMAPIEEVTLRDPSSWRLLGKPMQRIDVVEKTTGAMKFGIDVAVDGMVYASVRLNPYKGAGLNSFDPSEALAMQGVDQVLEITNGVAAIATNSWYAMQGVNAVSCDWATGDYLPNQADHWAALEVSFAPEKVEHVWRDDGDLGAVSDGATVIEAEYRAPYVAHQPLEPLNAIALVTNDGAEIWVGHQIPNGVHQMTAAITGHDPANVTFHNQYSGGSFGHRLEFENVRAVAEIANQLRGTPVKLTFTREEDFLQDFPRHLSIGRMTGAVADGKILSADYHVSATPVFKSWLGRMGMDPIVPEPQTPLGMRNMVYDIPNFRVTTYAVDGLSPVTTWRSVGASSGGFLGEGFLDELIHAAGLDPLQARIDMCQIDYYRKVLEAVAEMSNWRGPLGNGKGRGVAMVESFGVPCAEVVEVTATDDGIRIDNVWAAAEVGPVLDPVNFENHVQGAIVWGLGHAMNAELTYKDGAVEQRNYHAHEGMRLYQCPEIEVRGLANGPVIRGIGEPPVPPAAPALANAIFAATGQRIREMPFNKFIDFV
ncbi:xanthine dehydrogenase family protein molybdopterin-binding subunit [Rhodobacteraceae bacterium NNCM2]|nr:xanthine dehydrogenase family protein molybdopterin-binding subunit [Coraliihabitans acroporae]